MSANAGTPTSGSPACLVVGGGWAGCAAAATLALAGQRVLLLEASRQLGGRARGLELDGLQLDNGQHILLGAYSATLSLFKRLGIRESQALLRLPLQMPYPPGTDGMQLAAPRLPAPLHMLGALLTARGLTKQDKLAIARFHSSARWMDWILYQDCSVAELLERHQQTANAVRLLWRPLCLAALNTPLERASAQVFLNVLKDSLGARRHASDMLLPRTDLSTLFPTRAAECVRAAGGEVRLGARVNRLARDGKDWMAHTAEGEVRASRVILATPPWVSAQLLAGVLEQPIPQFEYEPISTVYLRYGHDLRLARPFYALTEDPQRGHWGQFVFDRGHLDPQAGGVLAVVISASAAATEAQADSLSSQVATQLAQALDMPVLERPQWTRVIHEKRATFACTPGLQRPANDLGLPALWLAGDYTASPYPATIESSVRSALEATRLALAQSSSRTRDKA